MESQQYWRSLFCAIKFVMGHYVRKNCFKRFNRSVKISVSKHMYAGVQAVLPGVLCTE